METNSIEGMYYDRVIRDETVSLINKNGPFCWLIDYVKNRADLDFQTGSNKSCTWISVYRGTGCIFKLMGKKRGGYSITAHKKYKSLNPYFFTNQSPSSLSTLISQIPSINSLSRYYDNKKEGYYQNLISRRYGLLGKNDDNFIIVDKEFVFGYKDKKSKQSFLESLKDKYKQLQKEFSLKKGFPSKLGEMSLGNEFDFIALSKSGDIILIELKDHSDTQKIYLSPFQVGMYSDICNEYINFHGTKLYDTLIQIAKQKQEIGLLNSDWKLPNRFNGIKAAIVIGGKHSTEAARKYQEVSEEVFKINGYPIETFSCNKLGELIEIDI